MCHNYTQFERHNYFDRYTSNNYLDYNHYCYYCSSSSLCHNYTQLQRHNYFDRYTTNNYLGYKDYWFHNSPKHIHRKTNTRHRCFFLRHTHMS